MTNDKFFYCFKCNKLEPSQNSERVFKTGYSQIGDIKYNVGYCRKSSATDGIRHGLSDVSVLLNEQHRAAP